MCITHLFLGALNSVPMLFKILHELNILRWEKEGITIEKFQVSATMTVTVSTNVLPFTESQTYTSE